MSNVEVVQAAYDAFGRGDMESVLGALDPDIEWVEPEVEGGSSTADTLVVLGQFTGRGKGGREGSWRFAHVWKLRDGKAVRVESFYDTLAEQRVLASGR